MTFTSHAFTPEVFAKRFLELIPEYLPGVDTGAFEPTDRRRCWSKSLRSVLLVLAGEFGLRADWDELAFRCPHSTKEQMLMSWNRGSTQSFFALTGWGDGRDLEASLEMLETWKCPHKLLVYSCNKWQEAVLDQITTSLQRYRFHVEGEQYLFLNLLAAEKRFYLYSANLTQGGQLQSDYRSILQPVQVHPFRWQEEQRVAP